MSTTPTNSSHLDDGTRSELPNNCCICYYYRLPHILTTKIENVNVIIDNMINEYSKYEVGDYREAIKELRSLKEHYNNQEARTECERQFPIPSSRALITLLLKLIDATDAFNALVKKIVACELGDVIDTRDTKQYLDVIHARKTLFKFYKKELQGLTRVE